MEPLKWRRRTGIAAPSAVWPDWAIYWTLGHFLKPMATINLPKSHKFLGIFVKVSKTLIFLVKSYLGNFYRHLAIFFWSHWQSVTCEGKYFLFQHLCVHHFLSSFTTGPVPMVVHHLLRYTKVPYVLVDWSKSRNRLIFPYTYWSDP